jgi:hypothetical protein
VGGAAAPLSSGPAGSTVVCADVHAAPVHGCNAVEHRSWRAPSDGVIAMVVLSLLCSTSRRVVVLQILMRGPMSVAEFMKHVSSWVDELSTTFVVGAACD